MMCSGVGSSCRKTGGEQSLAFEAYHGSRAVKAASIFSRHVMHGRYGETPKSMLYKLKHPSQRSLGRSPSRVASNRWSQERSGTAYACHPRESGSTSSRPCSSRQLSLTDGLELTPVQVVLGFDVRQVDNACLRGASHPSPRCASHQPNILLRKGKSDPEEPGTGLLWTRCIYQGSFA